jgi:hypothetical protein
MLVVDGHGVAPTFRVALSRTPIELGVPTFGCPAAAGGSRAPADRPGAPWAG